MPTAIIVDREICHLIFSLFLDFTVDEKKIQQCRFSSDRAEHDGTTTFPDNPSGVFVDGDSMLCKLFVRAIEATSRETAIQMVDSNGFDLVLTDQYRHQQKRIYWVPKPLKNCGARGLLVSFAAFLQMIGRIRSCGPRAMLSS